MLLMLNNSRDGVQEVKLNLNAKSERQSHKNMEIKAKIVTEVPK